MKQTHRRAALTITTLRLLVLGTAFISNVLVSRDLGPVGRGEYQLAIVVAALIATIAGLSGEQGATEVYAATESDRQSVVSTTTATAILIGIPAAILAATLGAVGAFGLSRELWWLTGLYAWTVTQTTWLQRLLIMTARVRTAGFASLIEAAFLLVGIAASLKTGTLSPTTALLYTSAAAVSGAVVSWLALDIRLFSSSAVLCRRTLSAGVRYHAGQVGLQLIARLDVLLLGAFSGSAAVGVYSVAVAITGPLSVIGAALSTTIMNRQLVGDRVASAEATLAMVRSTAIALFPLTILLGVIVPLFLPFVWGEEFRSSVEVTWVLLPGVLFLSLQRPIGTYFVAQGAAWAANARVAIGLVATTTACLALIPLWGPIGAATGSTLGLFVYASVSGLAFCRLSGLPVTGSVRRLLSRPKVSLKGMNNE